MYTDFFKKNVYIIQYYIVCIQYIICKNRTQYNIILYYTISYYIILYIHY